MFINKNLGNAVSEKADTLEVGDVERKGKHQGSQADPSI